jgi:hypothetical protein
MRFPEVICWGTRLIKAAVSSQKRTEPLAAFASPKTISPFPNSIIRVTHSGLTHEPISRKDYKGGWVGMLRLLQQFLGDSAPI